MNNDIPQLTGKLNTIGDNFVVISGNLKEILILLQEKNPEVRVVLTAITLETVGKALKALAELPFDEAEIVQIGVSKAKKAGNSHMMMGQNPVFVITAQGLAHP